jgi:hypothetical protein
MAQNRVYDNVDRLTLAVASGTLSGDPVAVGGFIAGVAMGDRDASGKAVVQVSGAVYTLSVKGINGSGDSAVAIGDILYCTNADTPRVSKKATGAPIGRALATVVAGATSSIRVLVEGV